MNNSCYWSRFTDLTKRNINAIIVFIDGFEIVAMNILPFKVYLQLEY